MEYSKVENLYFKRIIEIDEKFEAWGEGEWVEEPDFASFSYKGYRCVVKRILISESTQPNYSGGHFCGYVAIPMEHAYAMEEEIIGKGNVHGGITFSEGTDDDWIIGFDCAHSSDVIPSMPVQMDYLIRYFPEINLSSNATPSMQKIEKLQKRTYKNINFCIKQCMSLVDEVDSIPLLNEQLLLSL